MINIVTPAKSGSKSHIFLTREPRTNDPVTLCGRDMHTDPTRPNPAAVGTLRDKDVAEPYLCKTCVKHWDASAEYRENVTKFVNAAEFVDWLSEFIPDPEIDAYDVTESDIVPLKLTHGQVKHARDNRRAEMKRNLIFRRF